MKIEPIHSGAAVKGNDQLYSLIDKIKDSRNCKHTINITNRWLQGFSGATVCGYASIRSNSPSGLEFLNWFPKKFSDSFLSEIDFTHHNIHFINLRSAKLYPIDTVRKSDPRLAEWLCEKGISAILLIPVFYYKDVDGLFIVGINPNMEGFDKEHFDLFNAVSDLISVTTKWQRKAQSNKDKIKEQDKMLQATLSLTASLNLEDVLNSILQNSLNLIPSANDAHIFLYENKELHFGAAMHQNGSAGKVWANPRKDGLTYHVARGGETILVPDIRNHELFKSAPSDWSGSIIGIPLKHRGMVNGVMTMAKLNPNSFTDQEINILNRLAHQAANVVQNVRTHGLIMLQAYTDPLTGLPNRRSFEWEAQKILEHSKRYDHIFTITMLDLNGFKRINDTYGHTIGDESLRIIAHCLKNAVRKTDFLARYGGDEFILLLPETNKETACQVANKIVDRLSQCRLPVRPDHYEVLGISYGLASFPNDGDDLIELIELADQNLYEQKRNLNKAV